MLRVFSPSSPFPSPSQQATKDRVLLGFMAKVLVQGKKATVTVRAPTKSAAPLMAKCIMNLLSDKQ
jgi:hypothetical protein